MTNYVANIHEALTSAVTAIREAQAAMYAEANTQRVALIELISNMRGTARLLNDMSQIVGDTGTTLLDTGTTLLDIGEDMAEVADKVNESTYDFTCLPAGSYEGFVGMCEECGHEIRADEDYDEIGAFEYVCQRCMTEIADEQAQIDAEVVVEPEQLTIDDIAPETEVVTGPTIASDVLA